MLPSGVHKRLETHAALGVWTCSVLKSEEKPEEALPYPKPGRVNKHSEDRERDTRDGWKKGGGKSSYHSCWRETTDVERASSICTGFLPPPLSTQGTAKNLSITNVLGWKRVHIFGTWAVAFVLALKTSPEFVQHLFATLLWRCREALNMAQISVTHLVVPSRVSQSECVLCHFEYAPV